MPEDSKKAALEWATSFWGGKLKLQVGKFGGRRALTWSGISEQPKSALLGTFVMALALKSMMGIPAVAAAVNAVWEPVNEFMTGEQFN